ncbi:MAG: TIGR02597 family protein [Opitutales bacterium]|nr:TIGR02597 family protein [Opitutales bacterium]
MKNKSKFLIFSLSAALAAPLGLQAEPVSVATDPVGYVTMDINGLQEVSGDSAWTAISVPMRTEIFFQGEVMAVDEEIISFSADSLEGLDFSELDPLGDPSYYVELLSTGQIIGILDNDDSGLIMEGNVEPVINVGDNVAVRKYKTLADLFGENNEVGLLSGPSLADSDVIYLMTTDGSGSWQRFFYQQGDGFFTGTGWRLFGSGEDDMDDLSIAPDDGVFVLRKEESNLTATISGSVKMGDSRRIIPSGFSLVAYTFPVDVSLDDSGIYSETNGYVSNESISDSDIVWVMTPSGSYQRFFYQQGDGFFTTTGWRKFGQGETDQGDFTIPAGSSVVIQHRGDGLVWDTNL